MKELVLDIECSTFAKGNPFSRRNKLMCVGAYDGRKFTYYDIEHSGMPYGTTLCDLKKQIEDTELLIGFNFKFDGSHLRRYIPGLVFGRLWDCQLAEFIINDQTTPYPSLAGCLERYGLPPKRDLVKSEYWDKGLDTDQVPEEILRDYNERDCIATYEVYQKQKDLLKGNKLRLFQLHCADLLVLMEMEYNGLLFNAEESKVLGAKVDLELQEMFGKLNELVGRDDINWNSPQQIGAVLYGGDIPFRVRVPTSRILKDGSCKIASKWENVPTKFDRLVDPLDGSENATGYSTDEATLRSLKLHAGKAKAMVELILQVSKLDKLKGTYYCGLPLLIEEMDWADNKLHGSYNQCVARTGRIASSKPNLQNLAPQLKPLIYSAYQP
jgi:DNA polymerase I